MATEEGIFKVRKQDNKYILLVSSKLYIYIINKKCVIIEYII